MVVFLSPAPSGLVASILYWPWQMEARLLLVYWGMVEKGEAAGCLGSRDSGRYSEDGENFSSMRGKVAG